MSNSPTQDSRSEQSAEQRRRKRRERAATSRAPEPKNIVSGAGQPLDPGVRRDLEERLGHDLSRVRLHTGRDAGQLADLLGADAVAVGQDIFFGEGAYRPGTDEGRRLLAHELLHTVQNPHGLGTLRAGRDLGAVSLPQQAIEREAESAAQDLVRDTEPGPDAAADLDQAQATPGWLRYATVDADRRRTEQLDPATLVDRLANGLLRSLRGDPEDRSGRVRIQLARMAPEVQDSVLDRLELRLPVPVVDRLLEGVEETERAGPLPMDAAAAPLAVPGAAEEIEEERRAREDSESDPVPEQDVRPNDPGKPDGKPQDGRPVPGGDREEDAGNQEDGGPASGDADQENAQGGAGSAGRQQEGSRAEQERSQDQQEDKDASGRDAEKDAADERKDASDTERDQQDQDKQDERDAEEDQGGPRTRPPRSPRSRPVSRSGARTRARPRRPAARPLPRAPSTAAAPNPGRSPGPAGTPERPVRWAIRRTNRTPTTSRWG
ncbi:eCIS core domain-containing protein [Streptomyces sp. CA-179760]|uniref:eCIS core domain-containing protein n=1 Tax=Streptomyces sp. CA-179760 TaxID=3240054 RepID=UPI003D8CB471